MLVNRWGTGGRPRCGSVLAPAHSRGELLILRWKDYTEGDFPASSQEKKSGFIKENKSQLQINLLYSIVSCYLLLRMIFLMKSIGGIAMMAEGFCGISHRFGSFDFPNVIPCTAFRGKMATKLWTQKFLQILKSSVPYFFWRGSYATFSHPFCFSHIFRHPFPTHLYLSSAVSFSWCFCFIFRAPRTFCQTQHFTAVKTASHFFYLTDLTLDFWLTLFINLATSDLAGAPSTLKGQAWEANGNLQIFFL